MNSSAFEKKNSEQALNEIRSSGLTGAEKREAISKVRELTIENPFDVDARLAQFLLPHQMEIIRIGIPLKFVIESIKSQNRNSTSNSLVSMFGIDAEHANKIEENLRKIQLGLQKDIREILFSEIHSSVNILGKAQKIEVVKLLNLTKKRADLFSVMDPESLISMRLEWKKTKIENCEFQ